MVPVELRVTVGKPRLSCVQCLRGRWTIRCKTREGQTPSLGDESVGHAEVVEMFCGLFCFGAAQLGRWAALLSSSDS